MTLQMRQKIYTKKRRNTYCFFILSNKNRERKMNCRKFFVYDMDGVLSSEELNTKGNQFAAAYYTSDKAKCAKAFGEYLDDCGRFIDEVFGDKTFDDAYFF